MSGRTEFLNRLPADQQEVFKVFLREVLIALVERAGGEIRLPAAEVDAVGGIRLTLSTEGTEFVLRTDKALRVGAGRA